MQRWFLPFSSRWSWATDTRGFTTPFFHRYSHLTCVQDLISVCGVGDLVGEEEGTAVGCGVGGDGVGAEVGEGVLVRLAKIAAAATAASEVSGT